MKSPKAPSDTEMNLLIGWLNNRQLTDLTTGWLALCLVCTPRLLHKEDKMLKKIKSEHDLRSKVKS